MTQVPDRLILGLDVGGSSTRAALADLTGRIRGSAVGPGGNPITGGVDRAATSMHDTIAAAARSGATWSGDEHSPLSSVVAVVIGMAGHAGLAGESARTAYEQRLAATGVVPRPQIVGDALPAFYSASTAPDGTLLLAGTGAAAHQISAGVVVRTVDGYGPVIGDGGSGSWIGRQAVRAVLGQLRGIGPATTMTPGVLARCEIDVPGDGDEPYLAADRLIIAVSANPAMLPRLVPDVTAAAEAGEPVATQICARAAELLADSVHAVRGSADHGPIVVNGSIARDPAGPIGSPLRDHLRDYGDVRASDNGVIGALWLARRSVAADADPRDLERVHDRLAEQLSDQAIAPTAAR